MALVGQASRQWPGVLAMEAGHKSVGGFRQVPDEPRLRLDDLADLRPYRQILVGLACNFTALTTNTVLGILKEVVFAHSCHLPALESTGSSLGASKSCSP